jgi:RimJ/RimL family protein N-acetyltransferase
MNMPRLETERLILRPPEYSDVAALTRWIGEFDVAKNLASVPYPYSEADGRAFVTKAHEQRALGEGYCFAILEKENGAFLGCCGLHLKDGRYEVGYWIGKPFWNCGYCTEAVRKLIGFAFHDLKATNVWAGWFHDNPASGRVLEKLGFLPDGGEPRGCRARGQDVYCHMTALTREDFGRKRPFDKLRVTETRPSC